MLILCTLWFIDNKVGHILCQIAMIFATIVKNLLYDLFSLCCKDC
jgi:hypothetical protein